MRNPFSTRPQLRVFALLATLLALALSFVVPSARADYPPGYPKLGNFEGENTQGYDIYVEEEGGGVHGDPFDTWLYAIHTEGANSALRGYSTEAMIDETADAGRAYVFKGWTAFPGKNRFSTNPAVRPKVAWIVANSYPENDLVYVAKAAGVDGLTEKEAITATQAAIWYFTDGLNYMGLSEPEGPDFADSSPEAMRVKKLRDYLVGDKNVGMTPFDSPTLSATAPIKPSESGGLVGPIRINSSAKTAKVTGARFPLVTADGKTVNLKAAPTGVDLFLKVPNSSAAASTMDLKFEITVGAYTGKILIGKDERTETIIVASSTKTVTRYAKVNEAGKDGTTKRPRLPETGA